MLRSLLGSLCVLHRGPSGSRRTRRHVGVQSCGGIDAVYIAPAGFVCQGFGGVEVGEYVRRGDGPLLEEEEDHGKGDG